MADAQAGSEDISKTYNYLVLKEIEKMIDSHALREQWKYFTYFRGSYELLSKHLDMEDLQQLELDWQAFKAALKRIAQDKELNPELKKTKTLELQENFADEHRFYIYKAFPKAGITKPEQEGVMDFNTKDIEQVKAIIRMGGASASVIKRAVEADINTLKTEGKK